LFISDFHWKQINRSKYFKSISHISILSFIKLFLKDLEDKEVNHTNMWFYY